MPVLIESRLDLGLALYFGFAVLFSASELCYLKLSHIDLIGTASAISLRESKTAVRIANAEAVIGKDSCLANLLRQCGFQVYTSVTLTWKISVLSGYLREIPQTTEFHSYASVN